MKLFNKLITVSSLLFLVGLSSCNKNSTSYEESFESPTIQLSEKKVNISVGDTFQLVASTSETSMKVFWFVRDSDIASIDNNGLVTALKVGNTVCYAQVGKNTAMCAINVTPYQPDSSLIVTCSVENITLSVGDEYVLPLNVYYGNEVVTDYNLTVSSENENVCNYDNGLLKALSDGESKILITVNYQEAFDQLLLDVLVG